MKRHVSDAIVLDIIYHDTACIISTLGRKKANGPRATFFYHESEFSVPHRLASHYNAVASPFMRGWITRMRQPTCGPGLPESDFLRAQEKHDHSQSCPPSTGIHPRSCPPSTGIHSTIHPSIRLICPSGRQLFSLFERHHENSVDTVSTPSCCTT